MTGHGLLIMLRHGQPRTKSPNGVHGWKSEEFAAVVEAIRDTDYVVLVTEPTPFGLNDLRLAVGMLRELELPFGVIINRCDIGDSLVWEYCEQEDIRILLELPFQRRIAEAYATGRLAVDENQGFRAKMLSVYQSIVQEMTDVRACRSER